MKKKKKKTTNLVHAQIVSNAVLPTLAVILPFVCILSKPLVNLLQRHGTAWLAHECAVDEFGVGLLTLAVSTTQAGGCATPADWAGRRAVELAVAFRSRHGIFC